MSPETIEIITSLLSVILTGIVTAAVPILIKFIVDWIKRQVDDKTLIILQELVQAAVEAAEGMFENGEEKKRYVTNIVKDAVIALKLNISDEALEMIVDMLIESSVYKTFNYVPAMISDNDLLS